MSFVLPMGVDFADGVTLLPASPMDDGGTPTIVGTALPTASYSIFGAIGKPQEPPGSPRLERAEQCTCEHKLKMDSYSEALAYWSLMPRGTIVNDSGANIWRILSCDVTRMEGNTGELHYVMESISFDTPPDDFSLEEVSMDLNILKHPRYAWAMNPYVTDASTYAQVGDQKIFYVPIKEAITRMCQNYIDSPFYPSAAQTLGIIQENILSQIGIQNGFNGASQNSGKIQMPFPNKNFDGSKTPVPAVPWDGSDATRPKENCQYFLLAVPFDLTDKNNPITIALAAAFELITKLWRQEDTPYIAGYKVNVVQYFFAPVYLNPGGYIEDPRDVVPAYFMSPNANSSILPRGLDSHGFPDDTVGPISGDEMSIFDFLTTINPQCYATNGLRGGPLALSCLRTSDKYDYERTWFKVYHAWLCAPVGKWDRDLYSGNNRPQNADDYNQPAEFFGA